MPTTSPTRDERGHLLDCPFIDNHGPSCACDALVSAMDLVQGMELAGWSKDNDHSFTRTFADHRIVIYRGNDGWGYVWSTAKGMTVRENRGYGTATHCLDAIWTHVSETYDRYIELCMAQIPTA